MQMADRKAATAAYKERKAVAGIFAVKKYLQARENAA